MRMKLAGLEGIEPSLVVLETTVLPLNDRPNACFLYYKCWVSEGQLREFKGEWSVSEKWSEMTFPVRQA